MQGVEVWKGFFSIFFSFFFLFFPFFFFSLFFTFNQFYVLPSSFSLSFHSLSDDSLHSPTVIPPSALDKPSIMKRYHRRRTCSHTSRRLSPTMVTLHDTRFVECRWWNDGWTVKTGRHLTVVGLRDTGPMVCRSRRLAIGPTTGFRL